MKPLKHLALLSGNMPHLLDHLAPFAWKKGCPLWIEEAHIIAMAKKFYPNVELMEGPIDLKRACTLSDVIVVSTKSAPAELKAFALAHGDYLTQFAFLPHGQSDKGLHDPLMRSIQHADIAYIYGNLQLERLKQFGTYSTIGKIEVIGNIRKEYYQAHKELLDQITQTSLISAFADKAPLFLYAPTWSCKSFLEHTLQLIDRLPKRVNLIIKLHPLIEKISPAYAALFETYDLEKPNLRVITQFPLIYPLLNAVDGYIGDESAIGYDFLYFDKPMFFLTENQNPLDECGKRVKDVDELLRELEQLQTGFSEIRAKRRAYAFNEGVGRYVQNLNQISADK